MTLRVGDALYAHQLEMVVAVAELLRAYPGKAIVRPSPTEIICETEPTAAHPKWGEAVAVIWQSEPHFHRRTVETYDILRGDGMLTINGVERPLRRGMHVVIPPGSTHSVHASGKDPVWLNVRTEPGWTSEDHILAAE